MKLSPTGYVTRIITSNMSVSRRNQYLGQSQNLCQVFWMFMFLFVYTFGGLRRKSQIRNDIPDVAVKQDDDLEMWRRRERSGEISGRIFYGLLLVTYIAFAIVLFVKSGFWVTVLYLVGVPLVAGIALCLLLYSVMWFPESDLYKLVTGWIRSKKDKVCPIFTFA